MGVSYKIRDCTRISTVQMSLVDDAVSARKNGKSDKIGYEALLAISVQVYASCL